MVERIVAVVETGPCTYIGIQPPIQEAAAAAIAECLKLPDYAALSGVAHRTEAASGQPGDPPYTEFGFDVTEGIGLLGVDKVREDLGGILLQIVQQLEDESDGTTILDSIESDEEITIFGPEADKLREWAALKREFPATVLE